MHNRYDERNGERMRSARGRDEGYRSAGRGDYDDERQESWRNGPREDSYEIERGQGARRAYSHDYDRDYVGGGNYGRGYGDYASGMSAGREYGTSTNYGRESDYGDGGRRYGQGREDYGSDRDYADRLNRQGYGSHRDAPYAESPYGRGRGDQWAGNGDPGWPRGEPLPAREFGDRHSGYYGRGDSYVRQHAASEVRYDAYGRPLGPSAPPRTESHRGRGPKGYTRSDERIREDLCERLSDDAHIDASEISVDVKDGTVTLSGQVDERWIKHRAEDIADACGGVKDVQNRLAVKAQAASARNGGGKNESKGNVAGSGAGSGSSQKH
jgi:hypothetical protein